jgi:hypothetical protein
LVCQEQESKRKEVVVLQIRLIGRTENIGPELAWKWANEHLSLNTRRTLEEDEVEVIDRYDTILCVVRIEGVMRDPDPRRAKERRYKIVGELLADDPRVGTTTSYVNSSKNSIGYFTDKDET